MTVRALFESDMDRGRCFAIVVALVLVGALWAPTLDGPPGYAAHEAADSTADWLVTRTALDGGDPYADIASIAESQEPTYVVFRVPSMGPGDFVHPRPPGALLLQVPLTLLSTPALHVLMAMTVTGALAGLIILSRHIAGLPVWTVYAGILIGVLARPVALAVAFGVQSGIIALLVVAGWWWTREKDGWRGGVAIGLAATLKLFPALLVLVLLRFRRFKAATALLVTLAVLNLAGMAVFGIGLSEVKQGLDEAVVTWLPFDANASIGAALDWLGVQAGTAGTLSWVIAGAAAVVFLIRPPRFDWAFAVVLVLALLGSPLSWEHYDLALIPFVALAWRDARTGLPRVAIGIWATSFVLSGVVHRLDLSVWLKVLLTGSVAFATRLVLLAALLILAWARQERSLPAAPSDAPIEASAG